LSAGPALVGRQPLLVTGGAGFIGCNIADRLAAEGHDVHILDALRRPGVERNLDWLRRRHPKRISFTHADVRDEDAVVHAVADSSGVFHMAAQVAVTTSMDDPREDFDINIRGTLHLLDALRRRGGSVPLIFASTNKVYGDLADLDFTLVGEAYRPVDRAIEAHGVDERRPLDFHTPYGCSKGAADQYVLDYARSFGVPTAVLRMSCIYGQRQMGTEDQGWVAHFLIRALEEKPITLYGDGYQVRDILDVRDAVAAYHALWTNIGRWSGHAFNLGGGSANAVSLRQLLATIGDIIGQAPELHFEDWRAGDQRYFVADSRRLRSALNLPAPRGWREGVADLARWLAEDRGLTLPAIQPLLKASA
jgi:CDP-paratose 2-epimerase